MWTVVWIVGVLVVLVGAWLGVDWWTSKRTQGQMLARAKDQHDANLGVGYSTFERDVRSSQHDNLG